MNGSPALELVDGVPGEPPHLDNPAVCLPFGAPRLTAGWAGHRLVLDLAAGRRLEPESGVPAIESGAADVRR
ncbi:hypothetical protein [Nocardia aurantia]|uniref:hypothetical protein n=1 Tax=Nocardia aurantia TaxID=2585199 RepID=UPI0018863979|nr:hypothetical protein [Nocardia aurantia]